MPYTETQKTEMYNDAGLNDTQRTKIEEVASQIGATVRYSTSRDASGNILKRLILHYSSIQSQYPQKF